MIVAPKKVRLKTGLEILLRSATPEDSENLLTHLRKTHEESYKNLNQSAEYWKSVTVQDEQRILADFEKSTSKFLLVALLDSKIIGGLGIVGSMAEFSKKNASLGMSVQKAYCNSGLGTELIRYALEQAKIGGFHRVELMVRTFNLPGIALYEKLGFQRIGLLKGAAFIDGEFFDEYSYQKILT